MATFTVTSANDNGGGSLRQAVRDANAAAGADTIVFDAAFDGGAEDVIRLTSGQIRICEALTIEGGGVTITGDAAGNDRTDADGRPLEIANKDGGLVLTIGPGRQTYRLRHWSGDRFVFAPSGENANPGSVSEVAFKGGTGRATAATVEFWDQNDLGTFSR